MILPVHINVHDPASLIANFLFAGQISWVREPEVRRLAAFIRPGDTVLDIGVHLGQYAANVARLVGPSGHVVCVEPIPELAAYIARAAWALGLPVDVINAAASGRSGTATLHIPVQDDRPLAPQASLHPHGSDRYDRIEVPLVRLDDLDTPRPVAFVKIDVEGHELAVLQGARNLIGRDRPILLVEIERRHVTHPSRRHSPSSRASATPAPSSTSGAPCSPYRRSTRRLTSARTIPRGAMSTTSSLRLCQRPDGR